MSEVESFNTILIKFYIEPILHVSCTTVGFALGYLIHRYEETAEERTERLLARYQHAPREWAEQIKKDDEL